MKKVDTTIIGAGSAGLSALRQVQKQTDDYVLIDHGPLGTTCARVGCMPSKVLIQTARDYHRRLILNETGIQGGENLRPDMPEILGHIRKMRDGFTSGMVKATRKLAGRNFIQGRASFISPNVIKVDDEQIETRNTVIATGSKPIIPEAWQNFKDRILTSGNIFEQNDLPSRIAVIGLGPVGLELGQALARLGIEITGFSLLETIGGLTDPQIISQAIGFVNEEMSLHIGHRAEAEEIAGKLKVSAGDNTVTVDKLLVAMGVAPNLDGLGMENLGVKLDKRGVPDFSPTTTRIEDIPVYIAGDANGCRPILHEALDEGFIAGSNAGSDHVSDYCRKTPLRMVFSDPEIAVAGRSYKQMEQIEFVTGSADFSSQSRAVMEKSNRGLLHIYVEKQNGILRGAEMAVPGAEHLAHLLSFAIHKKMSIFDMLQVPFYHPTLEEGLQSALRDAAGQLPEGTRKAQMLICKSHAEPPLC